MAEDSNLTQLERVPTGSPSDLEKEDRAAQDSRGQLSEGTAVEPSPRSVHGIKVDAEPHIKIVVLAKLTAGTVGYRRLGDPLLDLPVRLG